MRRALIVGIDDYGPNSLTGCVNDATRVQRVLSRHANGDPNFTCRTLLAPPDAVTGEDLRSHLHDLFSYEADVAFFHFSGHGMATDDGAFLVTQDAKRYQAGVSMREVLDQANTAKVREVVICLDCCHSGALGELPAIRDHYAVLREGVSVLAASRDSQVAMEAGGSGVFTSLLCDALEGGASDICGDVTVASVYAYVDQALGAWDQRPLFKAHIARLNPLRRCKPAIELELLRLLPEYFPKPQEDFPLDPSYDPDLAPKDPVHERIFGHLQKCRAAHLLVPVGEEHMYYAAKNSKACRLTPLGRHYWRLAKAERL